jgi:hypothetical protein
MVSYNDGDKNIFVIPLGYAVFSFGLAATALSALRVVLAMETGTMLTLAALIGGGLGFWRWAQIVNTIHHVWYWEQQAYAEQKRFEAEAYRGGGGAAADVEAESNGDAAVDGETEMITVNEMNSSHRIPRLTSDEIEIQEEIGQCLRFIAIALRAEGKLTIREMFKRAPGTSKSDFERWWTARTDSLAAWGFIEKGEKTPTRLRYNLTLGQVRAALLRRDFPQQGA